MSESTNDILKEIFSTPIDESAALTPIDQKLLTRFKCVCAYDGTDYCGWQSQIDGGSVQDKIEQRLKAIFKRPIRIHGSGRTDAGVHADAQVFHFDAQWNHSTEALQAAISSCHLQTLQIISVKKVSKKFHARYSVKGKRYVYRIYEQSAPPKLARYVWSLNGRKLDIAAMNAAAQTLIGLHDFTAFSASRGDDSKVNPVKHLRKLQVAKVGNNVKITTEGSGYLYKMVRLLTGALVAVGTGKLQPADLREILDAKIRSNRFQGAPAKGLTLEKVFY